MLHWKTPSLTRWFICSSVLLVLVFSTVHAQEASDAVRVMAPLLAASFADGLRTSSTFRALVHELDSSDLIVHVRGASPYESKQIVGAMHFVQAVGGRRYVRVTVNERLRPDARTAILAHELQHAVEVARAPWVLDLRSLAMLYRHIGTRLCVCRTSACFETIDARRAEAQVLREIRRAATDSSVVR